MNFFHAKPDRGATRAYVPSGIAIDRSVFTNSFPRAGTTQSCALRHSRSRRLVSRRKFKFPSPFARARVGVPFVARPTTRAAFRPRETREKSRFRTSPDRIPPRLRSLASASSRRRSVASRAAPRTPSFARVFVRASSRASSSRFGVRGARGCDASRASSREAVASRRVASRDGDADRSSLDRPHSVARRGRRRG